MPFVVRPLRAAAAVCSAAAPALAILLATSFILFATASHAQNVAPAPNSDPTYQALRTLTLGSEAVTVTNFELKRDAGTFHLHSGTVCFVAPVNGKVTGAVFVGEGNFVLDPAQEMERKSLKLLTKEDEFSEKFEHLVLRFTDSTYATKSRKGGSSCNGRLRRRPL